MVLGRKPANDESADEQNQPQDHCRVHILNTRFYVIFEDRIFKRFRSSGIDSARLGIDSWAPGLNRQSLTL